LNETGVSMPTLRGTVWKMRCGARMLFYDTQSLEFESVLPEARFVQHVL
jgi:hypothetical protein